MSNPKSVKISVTPSSYKSAMWKLFGFELDENTGIVQRGETVCRPNRKFVIHMTNTELGICPAHNVLHCMGG